MKKRLLKGLSIFSLLFILLLAVLAGCGSTSENKKDDSGASSTTQAKGFPVTIKDDVGNKVTIEKKPEKIVSLLPSTTETLFALGLDDQIVGVSDYDNFPEAALKKEKVGSQDMNIEKILSLQPDVVFLQEYQYKNHADMIKQLQNAGITTIIIGSQESFDKAYKGISLLGKATGTEEEANAIVNNMKERINNIKDKAKKVESKKRVWVEISPQPEIFTTGQNTFMNEMLDMIGAENVAKGQVGWVKMSEEEAVKLNPDVILTTYGSYVGNATKQVLDRKGWQQVNAVKNKQVFDVNNDTTSRPGPRLVDGVEEIAKAVYPEVFK
ncbi:MULTISPECIES: ABC transporter substrate-binding protein [Bacillus]|uniref:ABC transporter substrate-binding protein n=1 Tax=Bacillus TaxID=1386 RepID=UPI0002E772B6|nr:MULTISPECIES: ABC transporter substrate-binding protein [Bacillus]